MNPALHPYPITFAVGCFCAGWAIVLRWADSAPLLPDDDERGLSDRQLRELDAFERRSVRQINGEE